MGKPLEKIIKSDSQTKERSETILIIRTEEKNDHKAVYDLNYKAFNNREDEPKIVEKSRLTNGFIPELSIVAAADGEIIGHLLLSPAKVIDEKKEHEVIALGPVAVQPERQKQGIGKALIEEGLERCRKLGYGLVLLIGHTSYYPKFGFQPARPFGLELKQYDVPDDVFMVCEIQKGALQKIKGEFQFPDIFF